LIGKLLVFLNSEKMREQIISIAGRNPDDFNGTKYFEFKKKCIGDGKRRNRARYEVVNLQNPDTIEFRLFQSCTKKERLFMYLEFLDCLLNYLKNCSILHLEDWEAFATHAKGLKKIYPHLNQYI
jgi:hypothetical protein